MKAIKFIGVIFLLSVPLSSYVSKPDEINGIVSWYHIEEAQELASENPKPVFIDFTAKWCGWCKKMDKNTFADAKVAHRLNNDFYAVKVDYDNKEKFNYQGKEYTGKELAQKFGITGLPTMIFASSDFQKTERLVGYQNTRQFLSKLEKYKNW